MCLTQHKGINNGCRGYNLLYLYREYSESGLTNVSIEIVFEWPKRKGNMEVTVIERNLFTGQRQALVHCVVECTRMKLMILCWSHKSTLQKKILK